MVLMFTHQPHKQRTGDGSSVQQMVRQVPDRETTGPLGGFTGWAVRLVSSLRRVGMKACRKCLVEKDDSAFSKCAVHKDGLQSYCKQCSAKKVEEWAKENPEKARAKDLRWKSINKAHVNEHDRQRRAENPDKCMARRLVRSAILTGTLVRKPCEVCGALRTHGHHEDYSRPLDVNWLCPKHHAARHSAMGY